MVSPQKDEVILVCDAGGGTTVGRDAISVGELWLLAYKGLSRTSTYSRWRLQGGMQRASTN